MFFFLLCLSPLLAEPNYVQILPEIHHFGAVPDSQTVSCQFEIHNRHPSDTLKITQIKTFCSCTIVGETQLEIPPLSKKNFTAEFNPRGRQNYSRWEIQLTHNFSNEPSKAIFDVIVLRDHYLSHPSIFLDEFRQGKKFSKQIYISPLEYPQFEITRMQWQGNPPLAYFNISYQKEMYEGFYPEKRMSYCIKVSPKPDILYGAIHGKILVHTNWPKNPIIEVEVFGKVSSDIATNRTYISFGVLSLNKPIKRDALIYAVDDKFPFSITKIDCDIPFIETSYETIFAQRYYQINLVATANPTTPAGEFRSTLTIHTDNENQKEIIIPIQGIVLPK